VIAILDYGAGNLRSVANALRSLAVPYEIANDVPGLLRADKIILPGVGHFGQMMRAFDAMHVRDALLGQIRAGVPYLGICLGLQALFESSEESPGTAGLGLFQGIIRRFDGEARVPHMGWNQVDPGVDGTKSKLLEGLPPKPYLYFAHSYYAPAEPSAAATCAYGGTVFTALLERDNVFAIQFHPEKSGAIGRRLLRNFAEM
jgi:imidazole glycerol-phosphate synthase subunit HisH